MVFVKALARVRSCLFVGRQMDYNWRWSSRQGSRDEHGTKSHWECPSQGHTSGLRQDTYEETGLEKYHYVELPTRPARWRWALLCHPTKASPQLEEEGSTHWPPTHTGERSHQEVEQGPLDPEARVGESRYTRMLGGTGAPPGRIAKVHMRDGRHHTCLKGLLMGKKKCDTEGWSLKDQWPVLVWRRVWNLLNLDAYGATQWEWGAARCVHWTAGGGQRPRRKAGKQSCR